jgi:hypothetical protein
MRKPSPLAKIHVARANAPHEVQCISPRFFEHCGRADRPFLNRIV